MSPVLFEETTIVLACLGGEGGAGEHRVLSSIPSPLDMLLRSLAAGGGGKSVSFCGRPKQRSVV